MAAVFRDAALLALFVKARGEVLIDGVAALGVFKCRCLSCACAQVAIRAQLAPKTGGLVAGILFTGACVWCILAPQGGEAEKKSLLA